MKHSIPLLLSLMAIPAISTAELTLNVSESPNRANPVALNSSQLNGTAYIFLDASEESVTQVTFSLNGTQTQIEKNPPYDFAGTAGVLGIPFLTDTLSTGNHTISAEVLLTSDTVQTINATFTVSDTGTEPPEEEPPTTNAALLFSTNDTRSSEAPLENATLNGNVFIFVAPTTNIIKAVFYVDDPQKNNPPIQVEGAAPLDLAGTISLGSASIAKPFNTESLADGEHILTVDLTLSGGGQVQIDASFTVNNTDITEPEPPTPPNNDTNCQPISPLLCNNIRKNGDLLLDFKNNAGGLTDQNGKEIGFTMVDAPSTPGNPTPLETAPGFRADKITVDNTLGRLTLNSTPGLRVLGTNTQDNALGFGLNVPSQTVTLKTKIVDLSASPSGGWAQAGLWFGAADKAGLGSSEDNYIKLVVASPTAGTYVIQSALEIKGQRVSDRTISVPSNISDVELILTANPSERSIELRYNSNSGSDLLTKFTELPDEWFSFDQAGINPNIGTRSFGGIFASSRNSSSAVDYHFESFSLSEGQPPVEAGSVEFDRWSFDIFKPTAMALGPDGKLYVAEVLGTLHALTLDHTNKTVLQDEVINTITDNHGGNRLTLGLAIDPDSTSNNVMLWVNHSSGSFDNGEVNSGVISLLSGPSLNTIENRITGLPRAKANHALNSIHFDSDKKLLIAAGGNTGAGAPPNVTTEFGDRPEQPLTAAMLVADVKNSDFQGECATPIGEFGIPTTCDVSVYASGMRNSYDFTLHSNGHIYATDNGLGVTGTYPPTPIAPCLDTGNVNTDNPGTQDDLLYDVLPGKYYGHPNPYRNQCVFKDGSAQNTQASANFQAPMFTLGKNKSANGIIEYKGDAFFSTLRGELLIANFSTGDNITRSKLSADGKSVLKHTSLISGFNDPLPITQDKTGRIFVGENGGSKVTVLIPKPLTSEPTGNFTTLADLPAPILDGGGAVIDNKFYVVGGKNSNNHVSSLRIYDPVNNTWTTGASMPGSAVENPATAAYKGKLYVFGGSTGPFSGATKATMMYDPEQNSWQTLEEMSVARGGARAEVLDNKIYILGGLNKNGASLDSVEIFDPVQQTWQAGTAMQSVRDNLSSAVINGKLYAFGGRIRQANGTTIEAALTSLEIFDPETSLWTFGQAMPTGRRAMIAGVISGRIQVMGGESPVTAANEEYDPISNSWRTLQSLPQPKHGAAYATLNGKVYIAGGSAIAGAQPSQDVIVFQY